MDNSNTTNARGLCDSSLIMPSSKGNNLLERQVFSERMTADFLGAKRRRGNTPTPGRYLRLRTVVVDPEATLLIQGVVLLVTHLRETGVGAVVDPEATCLIQGFVLLVTHLREARVGAGHTLRIIVAVH
ncbi:hypothetical protein Tco_1159635 [Tanacetum coccineum]